MSTHSSILAWRIPRTEQPDGPQSMGSQESDKTERLTHRQVTYDGSATVSGTLIDLCVHARSLQSRPTLCDPMDCSLPGSFVHGIFQSKNTGVGCYALLQGIFLTQGLNPCLLLSLLYWLVGSLPLAPPRNNGH